MALATTSAVWRSTGGDSTRTAYAGSMEMIAQFYIANAAAATANVQISATSTNPVILPANATVLRVTIVNPSTGGNSACNVGFTPITNAGLGTNVPQGFLAGANVTARTTFNVGAATTGASLGNVANSTNLVVVTSAIGAAGAAAGPVTGLISYYVADNGQQNV
jgi:hypothetical protein